MRVGGLTLILPIALLLASSMPHAAADPARQRAQEIAECPAVPATWDDGTDRPARHRTLHFRYDPTGAPADFPETSVTAMIQAALGAWRGCGLLLQWSDPMSVQSDSSYVIAWRRNDDGQTIGLADMAARRLWLSARVFALLRERNPQLMASTLQMTLAHEIGHFLGLVAHSKRCVDVTSYYADNQGRQCETAVPGGFAGVPGRREFRAELPTACDIARCRRANGLLP